ncbi:hypothetical protein ACIRP7_11085 [Streptomyces sp. NPDC102270]|uniref:hypothetical protein n=1 Tax=Streptomyces sp. NPDC102270 TaxID=3366150 RepID=UPI0038255B7F
MAQHVGVYLRQSERRTTGSQASTAAQREECLKAMEQWAIQPAHVAVYEDLGLLFLDRVEVRKAYPHAGQGVPTASRVSITWAGGMTLDGLPDNERLCESA